MGERSYLATLTGYLARAVFEQSRLAEAERLTKVVEAGATRDDALSQVLWRGVRAKILAREDSVAEALTLAREGVRIAERTDFLHIQGDAWLDAADVLTLAGRPDEAARARETAVERYVRKGSSVAAVHA